MENFLKKFKKLRDLIVFDGERKAAGRARLASYLRGTEAVREQNVVRLSTYKSPILTIIKNKTMPIVAFIAILALLGGGTSFAAEGALPGDFLYPVKIKINEQLATALAFSVKDKAELEAHLAEKRLGEASQLAAQNRLDAEIAAELQAAFQISAERAEALIKELRSSGSVELADEIGAKFESSLRGHVLKLELELESEDNDDDDTSASSTASSTIRGEIEIEIEVDDSDELEDITDAANAVIRLDLADDDDDGDDDDDDSVSATASTSVSDDEDNEGENQGGEDGDQSDENEDEEDSNSGSDSDSGSGSNSGSGSGAEIEVEVED